MIERPILRYFGGKFLLAPWVIEHFPVHKTYIEPFGGGGSVLMRKAKSDLEVYNDLNSDIVNVFRVMRDNHDELARMVKFTPYARDEFNLAFEKTEDPVERARRTIIRSFVGYGSNGANRINQKTGFRQRLDIKFDEYAGYVQEFYERLKHVIIENKDAVEVMKNLDSDQTLHFVDPPYVKATRGKNYDRYEHELTDAQHRELCEFLKTLSGMVVLCGYENPIYESLGWEVRKRTAMADFAKERTEVIWLNPHCAALAGQPELFTT